MTLMLRTLFLQGFEESRWLAEMMAQPEQAPKPPRPSWRRPVTRRKTVAKADG